MAISPADWRGYLAAVVTPFDQHGAFDPVRFRETLGWLSAEGMHGYVLAGTTGEWPSLTRQERTRLFELGRAILQQSDVPLLGGCGALSVAETRYFLDVCATLGLDGALVSIPPYVNPTDDEVLGFFTSLDQHSQVPLVVYNWPPGTGRDLSPDLLQRISRLDRVAGIKNSTTNRAAFEQTLTALHDHVRVFGIMPGPVGLDQLQRIGGAGCIGASGALGRLQPGFFDAFDAGDAAAALASGSVDQDFMQTFFDGFIGRYGHAIATVKALMRAQGVPVGFVREPHRSLTPAGETAIRAFLERHGLRTR